MQKGSVKNLYKSLKATLSSLALVAALSTQSKADEGSIANIDSSQPNQTRARTAVQYWHTDRHSSGTSAQVQIGDEDIELNLDYSGTTDAPKQDIFAHADLDLYNFHIGGGIIGKQYAGYGAFRLDETLGHENIWLRSRVSSSIGYGSESYDSDDIRDRVYAASLGTRIELSLRPSGTLDFLTLTNGIYAEVFAALPDHAINNFNNVTDGSQRYNFLSSSLSLSEGRAGGYIQLDAQLLRKDNLLLRSRIRHIAETVHMDIGLTALKYIGEDYLKDLNIDPFQIRHTTRGELALEYREDDLALLLGVFAQHTMNSRTYESALNRDGISGGFTVAGRYDRFDGRLEIEFYPASNLQGFAKREPSASLLAAIGVNLASNEAHSFRAEAGLAINRGRDSFTGLQMEGVAGIVGISYEFGGSRRLPITDQAPDSYYPIAVRDRREYIRRTARLQTTQTTQTNVQTPTNPITEPLPEEIPQDLQNIIQNVQIPQATLGQEQVDKLKDLLEGEPTMDEIKQTVNGDPILSRLIDIDYVERLYNDYRNGGIDGIRRGLLRSSDLVLGYSRRDTTLTLILPPMARQTETASIVAPTSVTGSIEQGINLSITPDYNLAHIMRERNLDRASLIQRRRIHTFRSPRAEGYMRILGYDSGLLEDLIRPRIDFERR